MSLLCSGLILANRLSRLGEELLGGRRGGGWEAICGWQGLLNLDGFGEVYISSDSLGLFGSMKKV